MCAQLPLTVHPVCPPACCSDTIFPGFGGGGGGGASAPAAAAAAPAAAAPAPAAPPKEEKTHVDIKLKAFDAKNKIKVIKEIRGVTSLGLKEVSRMHSCSPHCRQAAAARQWTSPWQR